MLSALYLTFYSLLYCTFRLLHHGFKDSKFIIIKEIQICRRTYAFINFSERCNERSIRLSMHCLFSFKIGNLIFVGCFFDNSFLIFVAL